jgi:asparagine synthetase B (glutamine-hydrolysing)
MCGIAGFHLPGYHEERSRQLALCAQSIAHRGPDNTGFFMEGDI